MDMLNYMMDIMAMWLHLVGKIIMQVSGQGEGELIAAGTSGISINTV